MCYVTTKNAKWRRSALPRALGVMPNGAKSKNMRSPHIQQIYLYSTKVGCMSKPKHTFEMGLFESHKRPHNVL